MRCLEFTCNRYFFNLSLFFLLFVPIVYCFYLWFYHLRIDWIAFYLLSFISHLFFLMLIPLEGFFLIEVKNGIWHPFLVVLGVAITATAGLMVDYYIGTRISENFLERYLSKKKYLKYRKWYHKWGKFLLILGTATPFLPGTIFSVIEGLFNQSYKRTLYIGFFGVFFKWWVIYILFEYFLIRIGFGF